MEYLKLKAVRGAVAKLSGQGIHFVLRLIFLAVLARLLSPQDFGLVAMVTAVTGVLELFSSAGLSSATVQRATITDQQISTLFWINILVGIILTSLCLLLAPFLVTFFHEPRLFWIAVVLSIGFLINAAGIQHIALLSRQLRYFAITLIETLSQVVSIVVGISMALADCGYWALVGSTLASTTFITAGVWVVSGWKPCMPRRDPEIRELLNFGGVSTLNALVVYCTYNIDKVLLGRFWGADALGIYARAYQLINIPTVNINATVGGVAFSVLSRLQHDPERFKRYFLKSYFLITSLTTPITIVCALQADNIIMIVLGSQWTEAAMVFRLLAPTVLVLGLTQPMGAMLYALGLQVRSLKLALVVLPLIMIACLIGLPYGPNGVAFAYSVVLLLWLVPHLVWSVHGTMVTPKDLAVAIAPSLIAGVAAAAVGWIANPWLDDLSHPIIRLTLGAFIILLSYYSVLLLALGQKSIYVDVVTGLLGQGTTTIKKAE